MTVRRTSYLAAIAAVMLGAFAPAGAAQPARGTPASTYRSEIKEFQAQRAKGLLADDGWLTVAGLFWLKPGANVVGSGGGSDIRLPAKAPGRLGVFELKGHKVTFMADPSATVMVRGARLGTAPVAGPEDDGGALAAGDLRLFVIRRGDRFGIRLRNLESATRTGFTGLKFFPVRPEYRVRARFTPFPEPRKIAIPNVLGQTPEMMSPGYVTFTLGGREWRLEPVYESDEKTELFFIFKDLTSRDSTYPAGRFLHAALPQDGHVTLDFNKAYNPPCAFTDFATCPLPPKQNQLAVRIEAGERAYHPRVRPAAGARPPGKSAPSQ